MLELKATGVPEFLSLETDLKQFEEQDYPRFRIIPKSKTCFH
jgi:hypothetical protein